MMDHLLFTVPCVEVAAKALDKALGVRACFGGNHPSLGTENALLALGGRQYLEILGPQAELKIPVGLGAALITRERWDISTFAVATENLEKMASKARLAGLEVGEISDGSRRSPNGALLRWRTLMLGSEKYRGLVPFFIDWGQTPHPGETTPQGALLKNMRVTHPQPMDLREIYQQLGIEVPVQYGNRAGIIVEIEVGSESITLLGTGDGLDI